MILLYQYENNKNYDIKVKHFAPWGKVINREIIGMLRFPDLRASEDIIFSINVGVKAKKIKISKDIIYMVIDSDNSLTKSQSYEKMSSTLYAVKEYNDILMNNKYSKRCNRKYLFTFIRLLLKHTKK
ncbi:hypothetical protein [Photobacterium leiognathi]|uniref:hypothetical protein n=1 Tax=Photobacterium leiognathi TaxID=553611 RepID=UPI002738F7DC|nr:hypothetical protein [Photobacterium leiognathi]